VPPGLRSERVQRVRRCRLAAVGPTFVETYRATVAPADCDHLGHMNVQHYFGALSDGMFAIMVHLDLGPEEIRQRQMSFAVVRAETDFHCELGSGDVVVLESTVLKLGEKSATFHHRLKNVATGDIAMSMDFKCVLLDLQKRRATLIPDDIRAAQLIAEQGGA
jgi:acyl-CoA thioester hydrolase